MGGGRILVVLGHMVLDTEEASALQYLYCESREISRRALSSFPPEWRGKEKDSADKKSKPDAAVSRSPPNLILSPLAMSTPARRRLMRDFKRLQEDPPAGVAGAPGDNNIMLWNAVIFGPHDTPFEDGTFKLTIGTKTDPPRVSRTLQ